MGIHTFAQLSLLICLIQISNGSISFSNNDAILLIGDILQFQKWPTFINGFLCWDIRTLSKLTKALSAKGYRSNVFLKCESDQMRFSDDSSLYILDINCPFSLQCLKNAENMKLFQSPNKWLIINQLTQKTNNAISLPASQNTSFTLEHYNSKQLLANESLKTNKNFELSAVNNLKFDEREEQSMSISRDDEVKKHHIRFPEKAEDYLLQNCSVLCDSEVVYTHLFKKGRFKLTQIYKRRVGTAMLQEDYAWWDSNSGITDNRLTELTAVRRKDLQGTIIGATIVINNEESRNNLINFKNKKDDTITKANFLLVNQLIDFVNGTRKFYWENTWGYQLPNGTWTGMVGMMFHGPSDIGGTPLFFNSERIPVIQYVAMTIPTLAKFVFRQPPLSYVSNLFLLPFSWTVWAASAVLVILGILVLYSIALWEEKSSMHITKSKIPCPECGNYDCDRNQLMGKVSDVSMLAVGAISQQGSTEEPKSLSGRISTLVIFVVLMFLYNAYSANIVALLQSQSDSIKTLGDLLQSRFKMGAHDNIYNRYYFPRMTEPVRQAIWQVKVAPKGTKPRFMSLEEGIEEIRKGLFAFHMETGVGYQVIGDTFLEEEKCGLVEIAYLPVAYPWFTIQKNSSFKEIFTIGTRRILETGLQSRQFQRFYKKKPECNGHGAGFVSVGINEIRPALVWLGSGFVVAIALLIFEKINMMRYLRAVRISSNMNQDILNETDYVSENNLET